jgi:peptidyl-prolyl cis-trans isomerase B (cyclophilin B)
MNIRNTFIFCLFISYFTSTAQKKIEIAQIKTASGEILIWLYNETPTHKASFIQLAKAGYWDSLSFNRVIPNFVAQGGCPDTDAGFTDTSILLQPEFNPKLLHNYGAVGAGRDDNKAMLSANCQFYIVQNKEGLHRLDNKYTIFGQVIKGMDIIDKIVLMPRNKADEPNQKITMDVNIIKMTEKKLKKLNITIPKT